MLTETKPPESATRGAWRRRLKFFVFALVPLFTLLLGLEVALRFTEWARPSVRSLPLPEEMAGLLRPDATLFWSLEPSVSHDYLGQVSGYYTNSLGIRYHEIPFEKKDDEFRILSLGESTTFGFGVINDDSYSAQLEQILNINDSNVEYQVINAGVPAWSSFQSLIYLKERGIDFKPDVVLFYHELNDYLPSSWRSSENTDQLGLSKTDRELYESLSGKLSRFLLAHSAIYRFLQYRIESYRLGQITAQQQTDAEKEAADHWRLQVDEIGLPTRLVPTEEGEAVEVDERQLPRRVTPEEREQTLKELADYCEQQGIKLVMIHPSYRFTEPHECLLTDFCKKRGILMFDAHESLHLSELAPDEQFQDDMHPTAATHKQMAEDLYEFLREKNVIQQSR